MNLTEEQIKRLAGIACGEMKFADDREGEVSFEISQLEQRPYLGLRGKVWTGDGFLFIDLLDGIGDEDDFGISIGIDGNGEFFINVRNERVFSIPKETQDQPNAD